MIVVVRDAAVEIFFAVTFPERRERVIQVSEAR